VTSANLDLVHSILAAWERGDFFSSTDWVHPDIEFVRADSPAADTWRGRAGMAEGWREWLGAWEGFRAIADEYRELDDERVLVLVHGAGRGKASGLDVDEALSARGATLFHLRDGKVTRLVIWADRERALADLGLATDAGSPRS
jgi:ketosteroid isomerase-like protein